MKKCLLVCFLLGLSLLHVNKVMACSCCDNTGTISTSSYVTTTQYCEYLNENASPEDTNGLYDERMGGTAKTPALIIRTKTDDGYSYSVASGQEEAPILHVSHKAAKEFCDWWNDNQESNTQAESTGDGVIRPLTNYCYCHPCLCRATFLYCPCVQ